MKSERKLPILILVLAAAFGAPAMALASPEGNAARADIHRAAPASNWPLTGCCRRMRKRDRSTPARRRPAGMGKGRR